MQRANTTLKLTVLAALLAHGAFAVAQATLPPIPAASVALAAPSVPDSKAISGPIGAAAKALVIGKSDDAPAASGSLKEMENLQREVFLGELRAKLRTQALAGKTEVASASGAPAAVVPVPAALPAAQVNMLPPVMPSSFAPAALAPTPGLILPSRLHSTTPASVRQRTAVTSRSAGCVLSTTSRAWPPASASPQTS